MNEFTYRHEINLTEIADEYAKRLEAQVDEMTLDRAAYALERYGYVKVIRCRDCIYMHTVRNWLGMDMGECWLRADRESGALGKERTEPDGFCAWAIRKEGGDD